MGNKQEVGYKVYKIETLNSYYTVYCEKNSVKYKIVSKESDDKKIKMLQKIEIGKSYDFLINLYQPIENDKNPLTNTSSTPYVIHCFMFGETKICEEENGLYTTENLKGLYYIKK